MSFVVWSTVALVASFILQPVALLAHDRIKSERVKDNWLGREQKFAITVPRRIKLESGVHRSIYTSNVNKYKLYYIAAFNKTFNIYLKPESDFIAPQIMLEYQRKIKKSETWIQSQNKNKDCFHTGKVEGDKNSVVSVSICNYMMGSIYAFGMYYMIQPEISFTQNSSIYDELPHVIYESSFRDIKSKNTSTSIFCGTDTNDKEAQGKKYSHHDDHLLKNVSGTSWKNHNRKKRASTVYQGNTEHHVELLVVADSKMAEFHGDDLQHYLFVLMSIVAGIYKSHTIQNNINIVVVKLVVLENEQAGPAISSNAATTLHNFCQWQHAQNSVDDMITSHHDTAVLITRTNICRSQMKCDTLGLAEVGTICDPLRSCSIVEDNGLSTAFTIAHELGHVFNLPHDDNYRCTPYNRGQRESFSLMAPTLDYTTNPWTWSTCSGAIMTEFLDAGNGRCLQDKPRRLQHLEMIQTSQKLEPGEIYNIDQQCKQAFGKSSKLCPYTHDMHQLISANDGRCKRLWCTSPGPYGQDQGCRTQHMPWADGTKCGPNMWCQEGRCMHRDRLETINGVWGSWEAYGTCSRTCGGGIKKSIRHCDSPAPKNGGKFCTGERVRYESCRSDKCQTSDKFREEQCARHNGNNFNIISLDKNVKWIPKYKEIRKEDRCKLFCQAEGNSAIYYRLEAKVKDGTKCDPDTTDVCVSGKCKSSGCDNVMGSNKRYDKCGVCDGDDSTCHTEMKTYNPAVQKFGYNEVGLLPRGSSGVLVEQYGYNGRKDDGNYLALKNGRGEYVLNGNYIVSMNKKEVHVKGAILDYSGSNNAVEVINGTRLIQEDVIIMVLAAGKLHPPNITYRYTFSRGDQNVKSIPNKNREKNRDGREKSNRRRYRPIYRWIRRFHECVTPCGEGRRKVVLCVRLPDKYEVKERHCERLHRRKPKESSCSISQSRSKGHCEVVWRISYQSACTAKCGMGEGLQNREYKCFRSWPNTYRRTETIEDKFCLIRKKKPPSNVKCNGICVEPHWKYGSWSKCTATCEGGIQHRHATCIDRFEEVIPEEQCKTEPRRTSQICNKDPCPKWVTTEWGKCSETCGSGVQQRHVSCIQNGKTIPEKSCDRTKKPQNTSDCNLDSCPLPTWTADKWSDCSVSCGTGFKLRTAKCYSAQMLHLDDSFCTQNKPALLEACHLTECITQSQKPTQKTTIQPTTNPTYPKTSKFNSDKIKATTVQPKQGSTKHTTVPTKSASSPSTIGKPSTGPVQQESTTTPYTFASWRMGSWTECSASCGKGRRGRYVSCRDHIGNMVQEESCLHVPKPVSQEACQIKSCGEWHVGDWSQCPVSCGTGKKVRLVTCIMLGESKEQTLSQSHCDISTMPTIHEACSTQECATSQDHSTVSISANTVERTIHWRTGPWGRCSKTCGGGWKRRAVACMGKQGISRDCNPNIKPKDTDPCQNEACPIWRHGEWNQCSDPCGGGIQFRMVVCQIPKGRIVNDDSCLVKKKPKGSQQCNTHSCPNDRPDRTTHSSTPYWSKGPWTKCSLSCGGTGTSSRRVVCMNPRTKKPTGEYNCKKHPKPKQKRRCSAPACTRWAVSHWTKCSKSCGSGYQKRKIVCLTPRRSIVDNKKCSHIPKPDDSRQCQTYRCGRFFWQTTAWSKCTKTCGIGLQYRGIMCVDQSRQGKGVHDIFCDRKSKPGRRRPCKKRQCQKRANQLVSNKTKVGGYTGFTQRMPPPGNFWDWVQIKVRCKLLNTRKNCAEKRFRTLVWREKIKIHQKIAKSCKENFKKGKIKEISQCMEQT